MTSALEIEIREIVAAYLACEIRFDALEDGVLEAAWDTSDRVAADLAAGIQLSIAEYTGGYLDEAELRQSLLPVATKYRTRGGAASSDEARASFDSADVILTPAAA
jgi:hypothetical protein